MATEKKSGDIESQIVDIDTYQAKDNIASNENAGWYSKYMKYLSHVETRGIERVPEDERTDTSWLSPFTIFFAPNMSIAAISTGALGTAGLGLDFWTCLICIVVFSIIGALPVGLYAVFGTRFGIRQQILSRFLVGNYAARIFALLNVISCIGWNAINTIAAVEMFVSVGPLPPAVGCVIIIICTLVMAFFGYKIIHIYERYSSIPNVIICFIIIARLKIEGDFTPGKMSWETNKAGNIFTFISIVFGFVAGWTPSAADYTVYAPANSSPARVFWSMVAGLTLPSLFTLILGAAMGATCFTNPSLASAYTDNGIGGLTNGILVTNSLGRFGDFCCVILGLSTIANNLPGSYSLSLSMQAIWSQFARVPRIVWCVVGNLVSLAISIPAYYDFGEALSNFLSIIGYNVSIYLGISLCEHLLVRKNKFSNYDLTFDEVKHNFVDIPIGYAGFITMLIGWFFAVVGMDQTWFSGLAARHIKGGSGDIGWELCIASTFIVYAALRPLELKYIEKKW
ncbi:hypothetical protein DASC09_051960 [Saccharomycopsis crataegensis]|uniref:Purine-cytosine permease n=1 Tax=Saccharomycopsis crataegensis TaxID=43959 RepID=A0AAV5QT44_9ASCO|nr:hypothetical protein DASC09_051960 [Saccharomycopsis crataegensis]